jgi:hypothetical protein
MADWAFARAILERGDGRGPGQITKGKGGNGKGHGIVSYLSSFIVPSVGIVISISIKATFLCCVIRNAVESLMERAQRKLDVAHIPKNPRHKYQRTVHVG